MSERIDKTIISPYPPDTLDSMWYDGEKFRIFNNGEWNEIGGGVSTVNSVDKLDADAPAGSMAVVVTEGENTTVELYIKKNTWEVFSSGGGSATLMIEIAWADLVALRDAEGLVAGQKYRIIDYETTTSKEGSQSAGHLFDIIVTALDSKTLDEKASAIQSARDTEGYFANSNLAAWDVRYCLDNDNSRFDWASAGGSIITVSVNDTQVSAPYVGTLYEEGTLIHTWKTQVEGLNVLIGSPSATPAVGEVVMVVLGVSYGSSGTVISLESGGEQGKGVIYELTDENKNKAPYDFKNIMFLRNTDNFFYTFCDSQYGTDGSLTATLCKNNKIAVGCWSVFMETPCEANKVEEGCQQIYLGKNCNYNKINENCQNIIIGKFSSYNTIHGGCNDIHIGESCDDNIVENRVNNVELPDYSASNVFRSRSCNISLSASGNMGVDCYDIYVSYPYSDGLTITPPSNSMNRAFITEDEDDGVLISSLGDIISKLNSLTNS